MSNDLETQTLATLQAARETTGGRISLKSYTSEKGQISDIVLQLHGDDFYPTLIDDTKVYLLKKLGELQDALQQDVNHSVSWTGAGGAKFSLSAADAINVYTRLLEELVEKTTKHETEGTKSAYDKVQEDPNLQRSPKGVLLLRNIEVLDEVVRVAAPVKVVATKARPQEEFTAQARESLVKYIKEHWPLARYRFSYSVSPGKFASISPASAA